MTHPVLPAPTLLALSERGLTEAAATSVPGQRYALAHLAALRAAAAVLSCRAKPTGVRRGRPRSAWVLLAGVAPELSEWAAFFAAGATKRAAAEAGIAGVVTPREADDLLRDAQSFLAVVETTLITGGADPRDAAGLVGAADLTRSG
jgi:hypothetical protein